MSLITDFLHHPILYSLAAMFALGVLLPLIGLAVIPFHLISTKISENRCPHCRGYFKRKPFDWEIVDEKEVLKTINRVDQGTIYSNGLFEPNHGIEINRQEQVVFVEQTILNHWACNDPLCGHRWTTEEIIEHEGSLG